MTDDPLSHSWQWQEWLGLSYLTCSLLADFQHGFFTRQFYPRDPQELVGVLDPDAIAYQVKQVHGNKVVTPTVIKDSPQPPPPLGPPHWGKRKGVQEKAPLTKGGSRGDPPQPPSPPVSPPLGEKEGGALKIEADGIVSERTKESVWVATADCTPVLIGDTRTGQVAAVHAGWRGTAQKIAVEAIALMQTSGSSLEDLVIAMGPAINGEVYQVGEQVAAEVGKSILPELSMEDEQGILTALKNIPNSPILEDEQPGRVRLDVRRVNQLQLARLGIKKEKIAIAPNCTYQEPEYFFSYRRRREKKIQWSGIVSN